MYIVSDRQIKRIIIFENGNDADEFLSRYSMTSGWSSIIFGDPESI